MMFAMSTALAEYEYDDEYIFFERCLPLYLEGEEFNYHVCGGTYQDGNEYRNHI